MVVQAAPIAIIVGDDAGVITLLNDRGAQLFGYDAAELLGRPVESLVPQRFRSGHSEPRQGPPASRARGTGEGRYLYGLCKDGTDVAVEVGFHPIETSQGSLTLAVIADVTERKNIDEMRQRDGLIDASELKSQFVATMGHELRTPLDAIIGTAELLGKTLLDNRQRAYVEHLEASAEELLAVISSLLDFSKIWTGRVDLETQDFELDELLAAAAGVVGQNVKTGVRLATYADPLIPPVLRGDFNRLRQILVNLAGNAVKFTERGHVTIRAFPSESSGQHVTVRFEVADTGIGITPEVLPELFSPFVQADGSPSRKYGGTGLGLSISKGLVQLMQGEIGVTSETGAGSLFWFTARLIAVGVGPPPSEAVHTVPVVEEIVQAPVGEAEMHRARPSVLVAEDNPELQTVLAHQFAELAVPMTIVSDGVQALAAVRAQTFALVFMDCHMPILDGFAATRAIRDDERTTGAHLPIVAVTANAFQQDRAACLAAGMDDYIAKPVRIKDFRTMIERWTGAGQS